MQFPRQCIQRLALQKRGQQQVYGVVGRLLYVVVQCAGRSAIGAAQLVRAGRKEAAALKKRAPAVCEQLPRAGHNGINKSFFQILRIYVGIPAVAEIGKVRGESRFMVGDGFFIAFWQRHFLPIPPEIVTAEQRRAHGQKVGLQVFRHFPAAPTEAAAFHRVVARQAPKGKLGAGFHRGEHRGQRTDRAREREVHQHKFIIVCQPFTADLGKRFFVRAHVKAGIFPFTAGQRDGGGPGAVRRAQRAVGDKKHLAIAGHGLDGQAAGGVDLAEGVVMEINDQPFHGCQSSYGPWWGPKMARLVVMMPL